jgi:hypothetical protein
VALVDLQVNLESEMRNESKISNFAKPVVLSVDLKSI